MTTNPDEIRRLRALAAEYRDDVRSDVDHLENVERRFGVDSPEHRRAQSHLAESRDALAAAERLLTAATR